MQAPRYQSGKWYIRYYDASGKRKEIPTTAQSKTEAKRLTLEMDRKTERQTLGLEALPNESGLTFWELCDWWLKNRCKERSLPTQELQLAKHIKETTLGALPLGSVTRSTIENRLREMEKEGSAPGTINKVRSVIHTVITRAMKEDPPLWAGANPVDLVESVKVPKRVYEMLAADEIDLVLKWTPAAWRGETAVAIFMGLRKGEILGLRPMDVNLKQRLLTVRQSFDNETTKSDVEATIPIPPMVVPYLQAAIEKGGPILFAGKKGKMRTRESDPHKILRRTLGRAGLVIGYQHVCRRCKGQKLEPNTWTYQDKAERRCERCSMRLFPVAIPRHVRFHDLRHSAATILLRNGAQLKDIQRLLRHSRIQTTSDLYIHLIGEDLRVPLNDAWSKALGGGLEEKTPSGGGRAGEEAHQSPESERPDSQKPPEKSGLYAL